MPARLWGEFMWMYGSDPNGAGSRPTSTATPATTSTSTTMAAPRSGARRTWTLIPLDMALADSISEREHLLSRGIDQIWR